MNYRYAEDNVKKHTKYPQLAPRITALAFCLLIVMGMCIPPVSAYAQTQAESAATAAAQQETPVTSVPDVQGKPGEQRTTPLADANVREKKAPDTSTKMKEDYPSAMPIEESKNKPAADYKTPTAAAIPGITQETTTPSAAASSLQDNAAKRAAPAEEITSERTATSTTFRNKDGTLTTKQYYTPQFYKQGNAWQKIDTTLVEDKNAGDSGNVFGRALGNVESWVGGTETYTVKDNDWQARFAPSNDSVGMVRIKKGSSQIGFSPVGANDVKPVIITDSQGNQTVRYPNLWPGVDLEYIVQSEQLKESIILKDKNATNSVQFKLDGAELQKADRAKTGSDFAIKGALEDKAAISPANLILNNFGLETDHTKFSQRYNNGKLTVSVDDDYLSKLPAKAFPAVIDPTVTLSSYFGSRAGGNYVSFKSDGYVCYSDECNLYAGSLQDTGGTWRNWRGEFYSDYSFLKGSTLNSATLHLAMRTGVSWYTGTTSSQTFSTWRSDCHGYTCNRSGSQSDAQSIGTSGTLSVTSIYNSALSSNDYGAWLMLLGTDSSSTTTFKNFDPENSYVEFTFQNILPTPTITSPTTNQVYVDPQVSFTTGSYTHPSTGEALKYSFCVSGAIACTGTIMISGDQTTPQWTIPDGLLDDGTSYYVQARTYSSAGGYYSPWGVPVKFRIDQRTGKDSTQAYDTLGPVSVDLATGNATTSAGSHSSAALGGSMGVSLDYNSPLRSRTGLTAQYWNNTSMTGNAVLTRIDRNVNFDWSTGSPDSVVNTDSFSAKWDGYFVAPSAGTYYFGATNDDAMTIKVNGSTVYTTTSCFGSGAPCYGSTGVSLTAGQVATYQATYVENSGNAQAMLYVKGAVSDQVIPANWLQTGVRDTTQTHGLTGRYYKDTGDHDFTNSANLLLMQRNDPLLSFDWATGTPIASGPTDNYMARWTGYITVPVTGTYDFGTVADDGTRITIGTTQVLNYWSDNNSSAQWGSGISMTAGVPTAITVDYYEHTGVAGLYLKARSSGASIPEQVVPSDWLTPKAQVLPAGWNLGLDANGGVAYDRLKVQSNSVVLTDSTGSTHEYTLQDGAYKPPTGEDGRLVKNGDGTFTLQDTDSRTYVFNTDGTLQKLTSPADDLHPAALQYTYSGTPSHLTQITDAVDSNRWMQVYYSGDTNCATAPSGYDTAAPSGMLCAVKTNDGRATNFFYQSSKLARIQKPGSELTDYQYDTLGRIISIRDALANDAIAASVRTDNASTRTELTYDDIGRLISVKQPGATASASRTEHTLKYFTGNGTYTGATEQHITGATEPNGFTRRIEYDSLLRTTKNYDKANLATTTAWDANKDLVLSTTDAAGFMTTTIYDDEDRATDSYGPAPSSYYGTDRKPTSTYTSTVPRTQTAYDENIQGMSVVYYAYSTTGKVLTGSPKLHSTNLVGAASGDFSKTYTTSPVPGQSDNWGFRATGRIRLPSTGTYSFRLNADNGVRVYVDDQSLNSDWNDGSTRDRTFSISNTAGSVHKLSIEYYHLTGTANITLYMTPPGGSETSTGVNSYISPDYSLATSTKSYDGTLGNVTATTDYGSSPEYGLPQSTSVDPTGLNLTATTSYETPGSSTYLRQTAKYLPGANTSTASTGTQYTYYGATETRDDPCTTPTEAYKEGGMLKIATDPDPDGSGSQVARATESIYDDAGRVVATRYGTENWTCITRDTRGRITQTHVQTYNGASDRTISNNYAVGGTPLEVATYDEQGWVVTDIDLLGRTTAYTDTWGDWTGYEYDAVGNLTRKYGDMGEEVFYYDNYNRLTSDVFDGTTYAAVTYDSYGRTNYIDYSNAGSTRLTYGRDALGRTTTLTYRMGDGTTTVTDVVTPTQSNRVSAEAVTSGSTTLNSSFGYDAAGRLTSASVGSNSYSYGFGTANSSCNSLTGNNTNAGKSSNRTTQTINGTTTTFCYDQADKLIGSSNSLYNTPTYDSRGNMLTLGTGTTPLNMGYDSSNRNSYLTQLTSAGTGTGMYYNSDALDRITYREKDTITTWNWSLAAQYFYGYTGGSSSSSFIRDANWNIVEKTIQLPGGVLLTVKPQLTGNNQKQYSMPSALGRTLLTANAAGTNTSSGSGPLNSYAYDPFGNAVSGILPANTTEGSYAFGGSLEKITETNFALNPIQMGARVYISGLGRFTSVDPIQGGTPNSYVYVTDPINGSDYSGLAYTCQLQCTVTVSYLQPAAKATDITATARITATGTLAVKVKITVAPVSSSPPAPKLPMASDAKLQNAASKDTTVRMLTGGGLNSPSVPMISGGFDLYHAGGSSKDWASGGALAGGTILCFVGAVATFEYGGTGCRPAGKVGAGVGGGVGWGIGFLLGGFNAPGADAFEWGPDQAYTPWAY